MLAVSMPNFATSLLFVDMAAKCFAMASCGAPDFRNHSRAVCALVIVSSVVKVFEATRKRVSSGLRSRVASAKSVPSTLETKRKVRSRCA